MGTHWYAESDELTDILRELQAAEKRIFAPMARESEVLSAVEERELLLQRELVIRAAQQHRGRSVTLDQVRAWPPQIYRHAEALGPLEPSRSFLDLLGWGTDYYMENLQSSGVSVSRFSQHLRSLDLSPAQACSLGLEILIYVDSLESKHPEKKPNSARVAGQVRNCRDAGLWLWFWGWLGCRIFSAD